ncbi:MULTISPECIES: hypothetical protein [unclassified Mesorhizobium]|uniref:hypothetical protein n=1 Tax=unclassified Mesorhizobium TaxID=325217 RepID=UPI001125F229|nr:MULTISPECIES: hypothetical protein [unclassified Mesorhizobium]TPM06755.1 hypothetical protein FJ939_11870 [Mesorhizobium sp. B2-3-8]TPM15364.1 hypothetical protein FJ940_14240 [Mesorhizobium sp. B2-3-7]
MTWLGTALGLALPLAGKALGAVWRLAMTPFGRVVLLIVLAAILVALAYMVGRLDGRAALAAELTGNRITILKDGKAIDNEVLAADDPALCAMLGGCLQPDAD